MSDFIQVPTTAQVRSEMAKTRTRNLFDLKLGLTATRAEQIALNEFDRWHQEELRQAKEQAWGEGAEAVALLIPEHEWHYRGLRLPTNPYRSQP